jgi:hypothetical protein
VLPHLHARMYDLISESIMYSDTASKGRMHHPMRKPTKLSSALKRMHTLVRRSSDCLELSSLFFLPVTISRTITPKLNVSDFTE